MWAGHLVHVAIPASRGGQSSLAIYPFFNCNWSLYSTPKDNYAGQAILTFHSELKQDTYSRYLSDIAHHHLALGIIAAHMYQSTIKGLGHNINSISNFSWSVYLQQLLLNTSIP
jgi:photosystem I P700 chlorophyll a apoprotein A2